MIEAFLASWPLFQNTYLAGWAIALLLSLCGVVVVARNQIFVGAAVAQASALGITVGMWLESIAGASTSWYDLDVAASVAGGLFAIGGALLTAAPEWRHGSREELTGWVFLAGASLSVLLVAHSPHGMEEVHRLMTSTLIGATGRDVLLLVALLLITALGFTYWNRALRLTLLDAEMARAVGVPVIGIDRMLSVWIGIAIASCLRVSGMVYSLGVLILPGLIAKRWCRELRQMFVVAPLVALAASAPSFMIANDFDLPPAHVTVALLVALVAASWPAKGLRR